MIKFTRSYTTTDGRIYNSIEEAKLHEIEYFMIKSLVKANLLTDNKLIESLAASLAESITTNKDYVVDTLTKSDAPKQPSKKVISANKPTTTKTLIVETQKD